MPLISQQDIVVVRGPYRVEKGQSVQEAAADVLRWRLSSYPPCRIVTLASSGFEQAYTLTVVVETV